MVDKKASPLEHLANQALEDRTGFVQMDRTKPIWPKIEEAGLEHDGEVVDYKTMLIDMSYNDSILLTSIYPEQVFELKIEEHEGRFKVTLLMNPEAEERSQASAVILPLEDVRWKELLAFMAVFLKCKTKEEVLSGFVKLCPAIRMDEVNQHIANSKWCEEKWEAERAAREAADAAKNA